LKISGAIETLILKNSTVIVNLKEDFFKSLGENKTIKFLDLTKENVNIPLLAKGIAMNAKRGCSLETVIIDGWMNTYGRFR